MGGFAKDAYDYFAAKERQLAIKEASAAARYVQGLAHALALATTAHQMQDLQRIKKGVLFESWMP